MNELIALGLCELLSDAGHGAVCWLNRCGHFITVSRPGRSCLVVVQANMEARIEYFTMPDFHGYTWSSHCLVKPGMDGLLDRVADAMAADCYVELKHAVNPIYRSEPCTRS